ncbi:MAG: class I SAM-dependent methyltransferase [Ignavibacteria bacterium]|nr:class I SAM-dependent methyltransferase [Ignavibacteria bacterium]
MIHISGTSALVLLWGGKEAYKSNLAQKYLAKLDLSAGKELFEECNKFWQPYFEIIRNRKFGVFNFLQSILDSEPECQVIILAAGVAPLSFDIIEKFPNAKVFDVDIENMLLKKSLYEEIHPEAVPGSINFIESDITNKEIFEKNLTKHGWDKSKTSIVVAEGISYYLTEEELWTAFSLFQSENKSNYIILESRLPYEKVAEERREIQEKVWDYLQRSLGLKHVTRYHNEKVKEWSDKINAEIIEKHTMKDIENLRHGKNEIFPHHDFGWIEIRKLKV